MTRAARALAALALLGAVAAAGCHRTRVLNGGGGAPAPAYTARWHHNLIVGIVNLSSPVDLNLVCPDGAWTEITIHESPLNFLVSAVTAWLYNPQTVTIYCRTGAAYDAVVDGRGKVHRIRRHMPD